MNLRSVYQNYPDAKLLDVIDNPNAYRPEAIETAQALLDERQLTDEQIATLRRRNAEAAFEAAAPLVQRKEQQDRLKLKAKSFIEDISPANHAPGSSARMVKTITLFFIASYIYMLWGNVRFVYYLITHFNHVDLFSALRLLEALFMPVAIYLFYRQKRAGWVMLFCYTIAGVLLSGLNAFNTFRPVYFDFLQEDDISDMFNQYLIKTIVHGCLCYGLVRRNVREVFQIKERTLYYILLFFVFTITLLIKLDVFS
ncbi:hypothetical protein ACLI1A_08480 [Flavobacterium sp. RHBU_3]|uniref:hypothetical protein n=1 Tax=Flavobacterium sp. RHBU_3 TaxID=3391184 RepID=UPI003984F975